MASWGATQAKAQFSALLDKTEAEGPQIVRRRKREFYLLTKEQLDQQKEHSGRGGKKAPLSAWDALRPSSGEHFDDVEFPRLGGAGRAIDL